MPQENTEPKWEKLADGSHLLLSSYDEVETETIERCFDAEVGVECIKAVSMVGGRTIMLERQARPSYISVTSSVDLDNYMEGFHCKLYIDGAAGDFVRESIWSERGELRVNTVHFPRGFNQGPLSQKDTEAYFKANSIQPQKPWLNCYRVAQLVVDGSFASLTSSDLKLETFTTD